MRSADWPSLYAEIGTTYGSGTGSGGYDFNLPDLRDRSPMGASSNLALGGTAGAMTSSHTHTASSLSVPSHSHTLSDAGQAKVRMSGLSVGVDTATASSWTPDVQAVALNGGGMGSGTDATGLTGSTDSGGGGSLSGTTDASAPSVLHPVIGLHYAIVLA